MDWSLRKSSSKPLPAVREQPPEHQAPGQIRRRLSRALIAPDVGVSGALKGHPTIRRVIEYSWRGEFDSAEVEALHAACFDRQPVEWAGQVQRHSLGWVCARDDGTLVGWVNIRGTVPGTRSSWTRSSLRRIGDTASLPRWWPLRRRALGMRGASGCTLTSRITSPRSTSTRAASHPRTLSWFDFHELYAHRDGYARSGMTGWP